MKQWTLAMGLVLLTGCSLLSEAPERTAFTLMAPDGERISLQVEIADEPKARQKGLMFRDRLKRNHGMLFVFTEAEPRSFWMKNTLIPLDIMYFDAQGRYVSGVTMEPCQADPCPSYPSGQPAQYALEVNAGLADTWGVGRGWMIEAPWTF